jgi:hypothetical protein
MPIEFPPYWEQIREESTIDLEEYNRMFSSYNEKVKIFDSKYKTFNLLFSKFDVYTTRYNSYTYLQNQRFKENKLNGFNGAIYSTTMPFPVSTSMEKYLFVLDMNNTTNKLMGISLLKNRLAKDQTLNVYSDPTFNNYIYKTKFYIDFSCVKLEESWKLFIENELERCLFYGKSNMKRGGSFTRFSLKKLKYKHLKFILTLFIILNPNQCNDIIDI